MGIRFYSLVARCGRIVFILVQTVKKSILVFVEFSSCWADRLSIRQVNCFFICVIVRLSLHLFVSLSVCFSVRLFIWLSVCLFVHLSPCPSDFQCVCLSVRLPLHLFFSLSLCLFICLSLCSSVSLSICLLHCPSVSLSSRLSILSGHSTISGKMLKLLLKL